MGNHFGDNQGWLLNNIENAGISRDSITDILITMHIEIILVGLSRMKGQKVSQNLVARIMKKKNLRSVRVKRFKQTTNSKHAYPIVENKLAQDFNTRAENQVWVSDITYIKTGEGWVYLTTVIDLFDRKVIG